MLRKSLLSCAAVAAMAFAGTASAATLEPLATFGGGDGFIAGGERTYLQTGATHTERGVAYNPLTNNVYVVSRAGSPNIAVLNGATGDEVSVVPFTQTGGTFAASQIRVADDGAIYVANLTTNATNSPFRVYRYASEADLLAGTAPTIAYEGAPVATGRFGDNLNIRGSGANTQIIAGGGLNFPNFAILSTTDGTTFTANTYTLEGNGDAASGVAFGPGDTVFVKQIADDLRQFSFTPGVDNSQTLLNTYPRGTAGSGLDRLAAIDVDTLNNLLGGLSIGTGADTVRLYSIADAATLLEQDFETFPSDVANANNAGSLDFGGGRLYVLDTNNGLLALTVVPEPASLGLIGIAGLGLLARRRRA